MPRLINLNGPPGIGKSTLARRYVDERFGVLDLDIDRVRDLVGGWQERFAESGELARTLALGMASTHLTAGHDVVLPQYLGRLSEIDRFERVARESGAAFLDVFVVDDKQRAVERFSDAARDPSQTHCHTTVFRRSRQRRSHVPWSEAILRKRRAALVSAATKSRS